MTSQQACRTNRSTVVEAWLRRCGSPDARASDAPRRSVLHIAAAHGAGNVCRAALLAGRRPQPMTDDAGDRPLHLAAAGGSGACVKVLLDHGADAALPGRPRARCEDARSERGEHGLRAADLEAAGGAVAGGHADRLSKSSVGRPAPGVEITIH